MSVDNPTKFPEKTLKQFVLAVSVMSVVLAFFSKVHFDLETRVRILEIEVSTSKQMLEKQELKLDNIYHEIVELRKELSEKANRQN